MHLRVLSPRFGGSLTRTAEAAARLRRAPMHDDQVLVMTGRQAALFYEDGNETVTATAQRRNIEWVGTGR